MSSSSMSNPPLASTKLLPLLSSDPPRVSFTTLVKLSYHSSPMTLIHALMSFWMGGQECPPLLLLLEKVGIPGIVISYRISIFF